MHSPERHPIDGVPVFDEQREELPVGNGLRLQHVRRRWWSGAAAPASAELSASFARHGDVQFGDGHLQLQGLVVLDRLLDLVQLLGGDARHTPVTLDANGRDRGAFGDEPLQQHDRALMLRAALDVVVVVVQSRRRIGFPGELERVQQVVGPDGLEPRRVAKILRGGRRRVAAVVDRLVDNVPALDLALVAADQRVDMVAHPAERDVARCVLEKPRIGLRVPHQRVADRRDGILLTEADERIGLGPVPGVLLRMHRSGLHGVFRRDGVELRRDEVQFGRAELVGPAEVERRADQEDAAIGVLHRRCRSLGRRRVEAAGGQRRGGRSQERAT